MSQGVSTQSRPETTQRNATRRYRTINSLSLFHLIFKMEKISDLLNEDSYIKQNLIQNHIILKFVQFFYLSFCKFN